MSRVPSSFLHGFVIGASAGTAIGGDIGTLAGVFLHNDLLLVLGMAALIVGTIILVLEVSDDL